MAFWWVSQNKSYKQERAGGYLWAPLKDKGGGKPWHWETMAGVELGDMVFSCVRQAIVAISIARSPAQPSSKPTGFDQARQWENDGRRVEVEYADLPGPVPLSSFRERIQPLLPSKYSPLARDGNVTEGYLFRLPPAAAHLLLSLVGRDTVSQAEDAVSRIVERSVKDTTERAALIQSRVGQGRFREDVIMLWKGRCCITGLDIPVLLRASHMKPWCDCNNKERLDPHNGLLLSPTYDAAFDSGLITFRIDGSMVVSKKLTSDQAKRLGFIGDERVPHLDPKQEDYLRYHREVVFKG